MMRSFTSVPLLLSSQCLALSVWGRAGPLKEQRQEEPSSGPIPTWRVDSLASGSLLDLRRECESSPWRVLFSHLYSFAFLEARLGDPHFCGCGQFGKGGFSLKVRLPPIVGGSRLLSHPHILKMENGLLSNSASGLFLFLGALTLIQCIYLNQQEFLEASCARDSMLCHSENWAC